MAKYVGKAVGTVLPPIAVKEVKFTISIAPALRDEVELFGTFFEEATGDAPASTSAIYAGILSSYLCDHPEFQQWKGERRTARPRLEGMSCPSAEAAGSQSLDSPAVAA
jgi:hypothetical protein